MNRVFFVLVVVVVLLGWFHPLVCRKDKSFPVPYYIPSIQSLVPFPALFPSLCPSSCGCRVACPPQRRLSSLFIRIRGTTDQSWQPNSVGAEWTMNTVWTLRKTTQEQPVHPQDHNSNHNLACRLHNRRSSAVPCSQSLWFILSSHFKIIRLERD